MKVELIVIGNEVLAGFTVNTNASFIGKLLLKNGYLLAKETTLPDDAKVLKNAFADAVQNNDLVIATGGLGPTVDDLTKRAASDLFQKELVVDDRIYQELVRRYGKDLPTLDEQATVPRGVKILPNPLGTAVGFVFEKEGTSLILLPGVCKEMESMFEKIAIPYILKNFPLKRKNYRKELHLFELSEHRVSPFLKKLQEKYPEVCFSIYPSYGFLSVHFSVLKESEKEAIDILQKPFSEMEKAFAANCFSSTAASLEEAVHQTFIENGWSLSIAESCTGGEASSRITKLAKASEYFLGSVVSYSNSVKTEVLGVSKRLFEEKGAVSEEVAAKMAEGVLELTGSDFSLAVTGIAGPGGGTSQKPVGTVWCAVARKEEKPHTWKLQARGTREMIIKRSVNSLFGNLLIYTKKKYYYKDVL